MVYHYLVAHSAAAALKHIAYLPECGNGGLFVANDVTRVDALSGGVANAVGWSRHVSLTFIVGAVHTTEGCCVSQIYTPHYLGEVVAVE